MKLLHCLRCDHYWFPRYEYLMPKKCPRCWDPNWSIPPIYNLRQWRKVKGNKMHNRKKRKKKQEVHSG